MIWILVILGIGLIIFLSGCKKPIIPDPGPNPEPPEPNPEPEPIPDPTGYKWPQIDDTTQRWVDYCNYMQKITTDTLVALEMKFYRWVSDWELWNKLDHWALPDVVWVNKKDDCDGLARLSADMLGRFVKISKVWWMEYYGYYRQYVYNSNTGEYSYKVVAGGHAITVYEKDGKLLAFSNTSWWNTQNFRNFIEIGELTFPEGLYLVRCRHWETGKLQWVEQGKEGEIIEGTNIFHRKLRLIRNLKQLKRGESKIVRKSILDLKEK